MSHITIEKRYWTTRVLTRLFSVSNQTLIRWRLEGLPHTVVPGNKNPVYLYEPRRVRAWAVKTKTLMYETEAQAEYDRQLEACGA